MLACVVTAMITAGAVSAATYTFDAAADLSNNFNVDVISGDRTTQWKSGYSASGGFPGSDGGYVHFNSYNDGNSLQFKSGPVFLNSFQISSQYAGGGAGVANATSAANDYRLVLYDTVFNPLFDQVLTVGANGAWDTEVFNVANVHTIWIDAPGSGGTGSGGWWPNLDNIVVNEIPSPVPLPASFWLLGAAFAGAAGRKRLRRKT